MAKYTGNRNGNQARVREMIQQGETSTTAIARQLGIDPSTVRSHIKRLNKKEAQDWLAMDIDRPDDIIVTHGTMHVGRNDEGKLEIKQAWPRCGIDGADAMENYINRLCERVAGKGRVPKRKKRKTDRKGILGEICVFDPHVGMQAYGRITRGQDYNVDLAATEIEKAVEYQCERLGRPEEVVVVFGGDILHVDSTKNQTTKGTPVDVDTHYDLAVIAAEEATIGAISMAAEIAEKVRVVVTPGNHDKESCKGLTRVLNAYYRDCPNVTIDTSLHHRKSMIWGKNLLTWTHGENVPFKQWPNVIAAEMPKEWGRTEYRYLNMGHLHHKKTLSATQVGKLSGECLQGLHIEHFPALCPIDDYHAGSGYVGAQRGAIASEYHKKAGRISRFFYNRNIG